MPRAHPPKFRQRAVELARLREKPVAQIAEDLGISDSCLRTWMKQADIDDGRQEGLSTDERTELVTLRRELRTTKMENEILKRTAAYFAKEHVLQNDLHLHRLGLLGPARGSLLSGDEGVHLGLLCLAGELSE
ncbi:MAG: transposase [Acidimicrobiales bacterium]|jgi:transposase-like protein